MNKYVLGLIVILGVILVFGCSSWGSDFANVQLSLDENSINLSSYQNECVINGTTNGDYVIIDCEALNISNVTVNVTNASFSYKIENIPKNISDFFDNYTWVDAGEKRSLSLDIAQVNISGGLTNQNLSGDNESFTIKRILTYEEIEKEFKDNITNVSYEELVKENPYYFSGVNTKYSGTVNASTSSGFDLAVDGNDSQIIHFSFSGNKLNNGDNITVWCKIRGDYNYDADELDWGALYYDYDDLDDYYDSLYYYYSVPFEDYIFQPDAEAWYVQVDS